MAAPALIAAIPALISAIGGIAQTAAVSGRRQYNWSSRLMQDQAALQEEAAQRNQQRAVELYDHQFQAESAFAHEQNLYNSPASQLARAQQAGISKAAFAGTSAQPAGDISPSASGAGAAPGVGLGHVDANAQVSGLSGISALARTLLDVKQVNADTQLKDAQASLIEKQGITEVSQAAYTDALTQLTTSTNLTEEQKAKVMSVQASVSEATQGDQITQAGLTTSSMLTSLASLEQDLLYRTEQTRLYKKYEEPKIQKQLDLIRASIAVKYAEEQGLFARIGLDQQQAGLVSQLWMNAVKMGARLDVENSFLPREKSLGLKQIEAGVLKTDSDIRATWRGLEMDLKRLQNETVSAGIHGAAEITNALGSLLRAGMAFAPAYTDSQASFGGQTYRRSTIHYR